MYQAGWGVRPFNITPKGYAMQGWGLWTNRAISSKTELKARTIWINDNSNKPVIITCIDAGYVTYAMRSGAVEQLKSLLGDAFDEQRFVLTCTHTHSGPGGCAQEALYNVVTPGYVPEHVECIVTAVVGSIEDAKASAANTDLSANEEAFADDIPVAWNRAMWAYNENPDVTPIKDTETHLAIDRTMRVINLRRDGELVSLLSLFGVHATCVSNAKTTFDIDNKGRAAEQTEQKIKQNQGDNAKPVAIFAQGAAGDVSPYFHGPQDIAKRKKIKGDDEYTYAETNGRYQSDHALKITERNDETQINGELDGLLTFVDFTKVKADPEYANGNNDAYTSEPCHGVAFFEGTRVDGPGMPKLLGRISRVLSRRIKRIRLNKMDKYSADRKAYFERIYAAQGNKDILMESGSKYKAIIGNKFAKLPLPSFADPILGELKRQAKLGAMDESPMVPTILPLQLIRIGQLAIVCCPGEFNTRSGILIRETLKTQLADTGIKDVWVLTYCNEYMGYVTTQEEYQVQCYEGGHTVYGQWTHAAFETEFAKLAKNLNQANADRVHDQQKRPDPVNADELAKRSNIEPPKKFGSGGR